MASLPPNPQIDPQIDPQNDPQTSTKEENPARLRVQTNHCRFCNHLLLATTRTISALPRRADPAKDAALVLPLPSDSERADDDEHEHDTNPDPTSNQHTQAQTAGEKAPKQQHYTILLSTTIPDRKPTLIRREDGFEKRLFLRCGRCRVVVGYFLDPVHFVSGAGQRKQMAGEGEGPERGAKVVYLLPGALMETGVMDANDAEKLRAMDREWVGWL
ncbi:uncharacterized protein BO97DRAFT_378929, partial [Aspergillus homomorphus CBS 101889]